MAGGWARDGAVQDQIDASVEDAAVFGTLIFMLAIARWQFDVVSNRVLWITAAWGLVNLAAAWAAVRRLATHLEPRRKPPGED